MKLYDLIYRYLVDYPHLRNSDKKLMWTVWTEGKYAKDGILTYEAFSNPNCPSPESIRRARQKIQELHPALQASDSVVQKRRLTAKQKGTHIFRERVREHGYYDFTDNVAVWVKD